MRQMATLRCSPPVLLWSFLAGVLLVTLPSGARADSATYVLRDLVFHGPSGQNGLPSPINIPEPGVDGHFVWTYPAGDFAAGSGTLLDITLPITSMPLSQAIITVDPGGLTGTNPGNYHDLTYDWQIMFRATLTGPNSTSAVDSTSSTWDFTGTYYVAPGVGFNGEWMGNIAGGTVEPQQRTDVGPGAIAGDLRLDAPSPNPFRESTSVSCRLAQAGPVRLDVFGADGRRVVTLAEQTGRAGTFRASWNGRDASGAPVRAGVYFLRLTTGQQTSSRAVVLLR